MKVKWVCKYRSENMNYSLFMWDIKNIKIICINVIYDSFIHEHVIGYFGRN